MKVGVLCQDVLLRDGLICMIRQIHGVASVWGASSWSRLRIPPQQVPDVVVSLVEPGQAREFAALSSSKRKHGFVLISVESDPATGGRLGDGSDFVVERRTGMPGIQAALMEAGKSLGGRSNGVREAALPYGFARSLTPREREVARLVSTGLPNRSIATMLGIQEQSVKNLVSGVMRKMDCENRTQLALQLSSSSY